MLRWPPLKRAFGDGYVLQVQCAGVAKPGPQLVWKLSMEIVRYDQTTRRRLGLQALREIDARTVEVLLALHNLPNVRTDSKPDHVVPSEHGLHLQGASGLLIDQIESEDPTVPHALEKLASMTGNRRLQVDLPQLAYRIEGVCFVALHKPRIADHIREHQDGSLTA